VKVREVNEDQLEIVVGNNAEETGTFRTYDRPRPGKVYGDPDEM
jgi:hypothetical protein